MVCFVQYPWTCGSADSAGTRPSLTDWAPARSELPSPYVRLQPVKPRIHVMKPAGLNYWGNWLFPDDARKGQSMIMSYTQAGLVGRSWLRQGSGAEIQQVRQVTSGSHRQPPGNPTGGHCRFGAQLGGELQLERMPFAPPCDLVFGNAAGGQRLGDMPLRLDFP